MDHVANKYEGERYRKEKNDCTVRAYAAVAGLEYKYAHVEMFVAGRKFKRGFKVADFYNGKGYKWMPFKHMTVNTFIHSIYDSVPGSKWIVLIRGHVFAVIDSKIHDFNPAVNLNKHVLGAWRCE